VLATADYGYAFPTIVGQANVVGAQFHPEKSQRAGIELLSAFARWAP
jgi:glutamine amidotransferase